MLSVERTKRVLQAIAETEKLIEREMGYPLHLRDYRTIALYANHIVKLNEMLDEAVANA